MESPIAMGIDLSLTRTGVAVVGPEPTECYSFGRKGKRDETLLQREERIDATVDFIEGVIDEQMEHPLIAFIEYPSTGAAGGSTLDRDALWWLTIKMLRRRGIPFATVVTQKLKIYACGKGTGLEKSDVLLATVRRHPADPISNDDEADATVLAYMAARFHGQPLDEPMPKTHLRALEKVTLE